MRDRLDTLTDREKETLRLLLAGHDAKSIARAQDLSVHTVNERLRDARRKLGVASSREAARLLAEAGTPPDSLGDKKFGVAEAAVAGRNGGEPDRRPTAGHRLAWLGGGMLIMSIVIAAAALALLSTGGTSPDPRPRPLAAAAATAPAGAAAAREWAALLDEGRWQESWREAAAMFRAQLGAATWAAQVRPVREPLGAVAARDLLSATKSNSLPGAPAGEYEIVQFQTRFAAKSDAVETVVLVREGPAWKVTGYYIR